MDICQWQLWRYSMKFSYIHEFFVYDLSIFSTNTDIFAVLPLIYHIFLSLLLTYLFSRKHIAPIISYFILLYIVRVEFIKLILYVESE